MSAEKKSRGNRRPSGVGSNSQRFAVVQMPDGGEAKVPAAKDAATYICEATPKGDWPKQALIVLLYDAVWLNEGSVFEVEEMRPGRGMGVLKTLRVIVARARVQLHEGRYGQMQRWVLCEEVAGEDEAGGMGIPDLEVN
ncbi:hypothetical protein [Deinococcus humi]|uniref:Uncharacterized protein n=1 Tax=Deinococcus humi TaxID=662880 RepID=A0A7W8JTP7_9DEIO|nr:hypothetical protein [Deinococcus humi]MBB5363057.1 hypothetical protein [Deinococcus humi]GGO24919.1 hypothetical protein GCM10008949_14280 [Deinococcus humi]